MATLTVTPTQTFISGDTVLPATLNQLAQSTVALTAGTVAVADLATATVERLLPAGAVMPFAMNSAPAGWLSADGTAVSRSTYAALFAAISTTYGVGDGSTTFALPDLRGYFVRGSGTNSDSTASGAFGTKQSDEIISHTHSGTTGNDTPDHTHSTTFLAATSVAGGPAFAQGVIGTGSTTKTSGGASVNHTHSFTSSSMSPTGGAETRPKNIAMLYCIKF